MLGACCRQRPSSAARVAVSSQQLLEMPKMCSRIPPILSPLFPCRKWATEQKKFYDGGDPASMASDDLDPLAFTQVGGRANQCAGC